jgi:hypothetical protein
MEGKNPSERVFPGSLSVSVVFPNSASRKVMKGMRLGAESLCVNIDQLRALSVPTSTTQMAKRGRGEHNPEAELEDM